MKTIKVKALNIGEGASKVIVPIVEETRENIIKKAKDFNEMEIDIIEWRVDFYNEVFDIKSVLDTLEELKNTIPSLPIIFTFRTKKEGGEKEVSMDYYTSLNKAVAESGNADLIDVEIFSGDDIVKENIKNIQDANVFVIGSNHDFQKTPEKEELVSRLKKMQDMGADIPKIAVMPRNTEDVLTLLFATNEMSTKYAKGPIITMSMGPLGVISRISGELFGSAATFGAVGKISAPGQIPVEELNIALNILHKAIN